MDQLQALTNHEPFVIQTQDLSKTYRGTAVLQALNLHIPEHAICGFLGPNGSGKTTAIKLLLGLARPTGGSGSIFGYDIARASLAIRQRVGYLPQEPRFYDHLTARETLRFVAHFFTTDFSKGLEHRIDEMLDLVGLSNKADRPIKGFSGGERQRLGIAQAQIHAPDLLILDEPAAALDPIGRRDVLEIMQRLRQHTTIFYSTHLLDDVQRVSDMVVMLKEGRVIIQAPLNSLLAHQNTLTYEITLRGATRELYNQLVQQPWVSKMTILAAQDPTVWHVTVNDAHTAEVTLLPLLTHDSHVHILNFGRTKYALEDIFVSLMEGKAHVL